jgi:vitamin B12 transporter
VTVIERNQIDEQHATFAADLLREVPGVAVTRAGSFGSQTQVRIWGAEANHALVMIDGVEANDLAGNDEFSFEHLTTFDIERIEVIRGPHRALWGSDALAGVINVVTRKPRESLESDGFLEGGSLGTWSGGARVAGRDGNIAGALSASYYTTNGSNVSRSGSEKDGYENATVNLNASWEPARALHLDLGFRHTDARADFDGFSFATGLPTDTADFTRTSFNYLRAGGRMALAGDRWTHDLHFAWTGSSTNTVASSDRTVQAGDRLGLHYQTSYRFAGDTEEAADSLLTFALDHRREEFRQRGNTTDFGNPNQSQHQDITGYVLEYLTRPLPALSVSIGGRYDQNSAFDNVFTYRITSSYAVSALGARLHASYGTGQKAPTFIERFGFFPDQFAGNSALKPEHSRGFDAGIEERLLDNRLTLDATYFRATLHDEINGFAFQTDQALPTAVNESGSSHRRGVQLAMRASLPAGYSALASYTYSDASQTAPAGGEQREVRRPLHGASLAVNGAWLNQRFDGNLNVTYNGAREDDFFPPFPPFQQRVDLPSYVLANVSASAQLTKRVSAYGRILNLFDKRYEEIYGFNSSGRSAVVGIRVTFDR